MGPKSKFDKRLEALERMERKGVRPRVVSATMFGETDLEYGAYIHRRLDGMAAIKAKIGAERAY